MWTLTGYDVELGSLELATEQALEYLDENPSEAHVVIEEYRPPLLSDLSPEWNAQGVWEFLDECMIEEDLAWDEGRPVLPKLTDEMKESQAFKALVDAVAGVFKQHVDLSEAAWQPTGKTREVRRENGSDRK